MTRHLSPEEIRLLSRYKLTGTAFAEALIHIESCKRCRKRLLLPTRPGKAEIIERLLSDVSPFAEQNKPLPPSTGKQTRRKWNIWLRKLKRFLFKKTKDKIFGQFDDE